MKCSRGKARKNGGAKGCGTLTTNRTFHLLRKGDTSNVVSRGTFLMSVDIVLTF
jgi:hypothetical protein